MFTSQLPGLAFYISCIMAWSIGPIEAGQRQTWAFFEVNVFPLRRWSPWWFLWVTRWPMPCTLPTITTRCLFRFGKTRNSWRWENLPWRYFTNLCYYFGMTMIMSNVKGVGHRWLHKFSGIFCSLDPADERYGQRPLRSRGRVLSGFVSVFVRRLFVRPKSGSENWHVPKRRQPGSVPKGLPKGLKKTWRICRTVPDSNLSNLSIYLRL